jgi:hypothetical protein
MDVPALASKLAGVYCIHMGNNIDIMQLGQLTALTALHLQEPAFSEEVQDAHLLAGLSSLQHLELDTAFTDGWMLEDVPSSLRSLELVYYKFRLKPAALAALGRATQLTSLVLPATEWEPSLDHAKSQLLLQLTGLQRLRIDQGWVMACGEVLGRLQHLKQLVVARPRACQLQLLDLAEALQRRPASLQHLVYICRRPKLGGLSGDEQPPQEVVPSPLPGVRVTVTSRGRPLQVSELQKRPVCQGLDMVGLWEVVPQV